MHQDSLRSAVYRSFVVCDDPKGVVECRTIRKSKTSSQKMEHNKIKSQRAKKISEASFPSKAEKKWEMMSKEIVEGFHSPSSLQLVEVSRGAQKLNQTIDLWSKEKSDNGRSNDVANDLLKGALDLRESLMMLGKLQEASQYMACLKKQQKKSDTGNNNGVGIERVNSCPFGDRDNKMGFQNPRLSADGSLRDCFGELRDAIRDSLARQNLLPKTDTEEKMGFHQRYFDSASEIASTSSSQSSMTHNNNYSSTDSPISSSTPVKKTKGPNLIAKLMGLEEIPAKPLQKQLKNEKISTQPRPMFDTDMRKIRKPPAVGQRQTPEQRTLKKILETMHFTGLLKSNSFKHLKSYSHHSSYSHTNQRLIDNNPPIVLIKPLHGHSLEPEEPFAPLLQERGVQDTKLTPKQQKVKEEFSTKAAGKKEKSFKSGNINRTMEETPSKRLREEEGGKQSKRSAEKPEVEIKQKGCGNKNTSGDVTHHPQRREVIDKKADKNPKAMVISRKIIKKETEKSKDVSRSQNQAKAAAVKVIGSENGSKDVSRSLVQVTKPNTETFKDLSRSQDQAKATAMKFIKPENGSKVTKNQRSRQQNSTPHCISNNAKQTIDHTLNDQKRSLIKREKLFSKPTKAELKTEKAGRTEDDKRMDVTRENDSVPMETNDICFDQLPTEDETRNAPEFQFGEHCNDAQSFLCDDVILTSKCKTDLMLAKGVDNNRSHISTESRSLKRRTGLELLLLSNPAFLSVAEELFDVHINYPTSSETSGNNDFVVTDDRLSMDCAYELIERISLPDSKIVHPLLLTWLRNSRISVSLDHLLGQVHDGVETLKSYGKLSGENLPTDSLSAMLEKDIRCKGVVSGIWDLGWRNEFSTDETEQVVHDIEKLLLNGLIDETFT